MRTFTISLLAAAAVLTSLVLAAPARAGTYVAYQCASHDGSVHTISDDWTPFGGFLFNNCASDGSFGLGTFGDGIAYGGVAGIGISVPASNPNTTIRSVLANWDGGPGSWSGNSAFARWWSANELLVQHQLDFSASDAANAPVGARDFVMQVYCSTSPSGSQNCQAGDQARAIRFGLFAFTLSESADPTGHASGGTLLSGEAQRGTTSLDYVVEDGDSGVRSAEVRLGTTTVASADFRGACGYDDWNACPKQRTQVGVDVDTTKVPDGTHRLLLAVTDAAGNASTVDTGQAVVVANGTDGGAGAAARGADGDRGAHNGGGDATAAILTAELVNRRSALVVPYRRSAVTISGRLTQRDGTPISGARLDVTSASVQAGDPGPDAGQVVTDDDGRWHTSTVLGPSRRVTVGWRAYDRDRSYTETTELTLLVRAGVRLVARPRTVRNGGRVVLSGRLLGRPFPRGGILVTLQGKPRRGKWRTFGVTRTRANGRFGYRYRFTRVHGRQRFAFRARIARQDGYPYEPAVAGTTKATVRG